jgi:general secretion pathway protein K
VKSRRSDLMYGGRSRGVALIAVLWVVLLLAIIAGSLTMLTRTELGLSRNLVLSARAEALAEGGIHLAAARLLSPGNTGPGIASWQLEMDGGLVQVTSADVAGRVDLNVAQPELIAGLLRAAGAGDMADSLADRIVDWRDTDDEPRPDGAEQADYAAFDPPVRVGNGPFLTADEILRIPGITMELWNRIADAVTVHSRRPGVNPLYAPKLALLALPGVDEAAADELIAARTQMDIDAAKDDKPATQRQRISQTLQFLPQEARRFLAGGSSNVYSIRARAQLAEGAVYIIEAVIELVPGNDPPWRAHEWRPGTVGYSDSAS